MYLYDKNHVITSILGVEFDDEDGYILLSKYNRKKRKYDRKLARYWNRELKKLKRKYKRYN